jgi:transposase InsO family protein
MPWCRQLARKVLERLLEILARWLRPRANHVAAGAAVDLIRTRRQLVIENALLRQQLVLLHRQVPKPKFSWRDRVRMVLLAGLASTWMNTLLIVQPVTLLRWHRELFRWIWTRRSKPKGRPKLSKEMVELIRDMATKNQLWGAERIRGELLKLNIRISKRTIQKYIRRLRRKPRNGQRWGTFLKNHLPGTWACDFVQTFDALFRPIFALVFIELSTRRIVQIGVTRQPSAAWTAQQLRNATPDGVGPRFLIRDRDDKFGAEFDRVAEGAGIRILKTPCRAPKANAICERFIGSLRRECLDHILILGERHLFAVLKEYSKYFNEERPHQGLRQQIPSDRFEHLGSEQKRGHVTKPVLGGLHHSYRLAA